MKIVNLLLAAVIMGGCAFSPTDKVESCYFQATSVSEVWVSDNEDGTYTNPILHADYSDPDVIRVGDDYFMTASSFNCSPGLPILHSVDLVNWQIVNYALPQLDYNSSFAVPQHGKGVWAPCIRFHNGEYYIYWGDPDYGVFMVKTSDPCGKWETPVRVIDAKGIIDPSPLWDNDGKVYLVTGWAASRSNINSLLTIYEMNAEGTEIIMQGRHVFDGHDVHYTIEGPKLYKKDNYYYILAPAGGVTNGWQLALRSKEIYGPYEEREVLAQGNTNVNGPHQGAWVETQTGESWFVHFQDKGAYGRVLHLQPMSWHKGWPVMGMDKDGDGCGEPVVSYQKPNVVKKGSVCTPEESDEFTNGHLGLQWQWAANSSIKWRVSLKGKDYLRLLAYPKAVVGQRLWDTPNLLMQKFTAPTFTATTKVKFTIEWEAWQGKRAGLVIMGNDYAYLSISKDDKGYHISQIFCESAPRGGIEEVVATQMLPSSEVYMQVRVNGPNAACDFFYSTDGEVYMPIGKQMIAQPELWIGAKVGLFCAMDPGVRKGSYADFDWFRISH